MEISLDLMLIRANTPIIIVALYLWCCVAHGCAVPCLRQTTTILLLQAIAYYKWSKQVFSFLHYIVTIAEKM